MKTNTQPKNSAELEEYLGDINGVSADLESGKFAGVISNYMATQHETVTAQVNEQIQIARADLAKQGLSVKAPVNYSTKASARAFYNKSAPGAKLDGQLDSVGEYIQAISQHKNFAHKPELQNKLANIRDISNSFGSEVPDAGGFLVPEEFRSDMLQWTIEQSVVRPRATVIPMSTLRTLVPMVDDTSHVSSVFGGITAYWTEEAAALTESQASFGRIALDAKKLTLYSEIPNELLADAPALNGWFNQQMPRALAWHEDVAFFNGSGVGEPQGFINNPATVTVAAESGQGAGTIVWENIVKMYARMLPQGLNNACWIVSPDTFPQLATMSVTVGSGGSAVMVGNFPGFTGADKPAMSILGLPIVVSEKAATVGTTGDITLADLSFYLIGDRQAMQADSSVHYKFANDKTSFRLIERVDGRPWLQSPITTHNNSSNTLSPFVQLSSSRS